MLALLGFGGSWLWGQVPERAEAYFHFTRAKLYEGDRRWEEALSEYEKAIAIDPKSGRLHYDFANALFEAQRPNKAISECERSIELAPDDAEAYLLLGQIYRSQLNDGNTELLDKSIDAFQKGVERDPYNVEGLFYLGRLLVFRGRHEDAIKIYRRLVEVRPDILSAHQQLVESLLALDRRDEAIEALEAALRYHPDNLDLYLTMGRLLEQAGETDRALEIYDRAQKIQENPHIQFRQGSILLSEGRFKDAVEKLRAAHEGAPDNLDISVELGKALESVRDYQASSDILKEVLDKDDKNIEALYYSASALRALGRRGEAIDRLQHLLEITESPNGVYAPQAAEFRGRFKSFLALIYQEDHQYDESIRLFREVAQDRPDDFRGKLGLIYALEEADRLDEALQASSELLEAEPKNSDVLATRARVLSSAGRLDEAVKLVRQAISSDPKGDDVVDLYLTIAQLYSDHDDHKEAEKVTRKALEEHPDDQRLLFQLGAVQESQKKYDAAEATFKKILEKEPDHASVLNYLGYMLADRGIRLEEARGYIERALEQDPYNGNYLDSLGWVYFKLDQLDLAEKNLMLAAQIITRDSTILEHLGDLYYKLGDLNKARRYYEQSVQFAEQDEEKAKVEGKLSSLLKELPHSK